MSATELLESYIKYRETVDVHNEIREQLDIIAAARETNRGVLAILITLLLKKTIDAAQDITLHQSKMPRGFSARTFDTRYVTPFLKSNGFPYMAGGSGALTRSLEQSTPFNKSYSGAIKPAKVKEAFLEIIDYVQNRDGNPEQLNIYLFNKLVDYRNRHKSLLLPKPINLSITDTIEKLKSHFASCKKAARLPQIAIYGIYLVLMKEIKRYRECTLCNLQPLQSADSRSKFVGDIQINKDTKPFEAVEIKYNILSTPQIVDDCYQKIKNTQINTYYLLSTNERLENPEEIGKKIIYIYKNHGCQLIVNGVFNTIKYYLRHLSDTSLFINNYVELLEQEETYETKIKWKNIC